MVCVKSSQYQGFLLQLQNNNFVILSLALQNNGNLSHPGCALRVNLNGVGVKLQGFAESLMIGMALQSFIDNLFLILITG